MRARLFAIALFAVPQSVLACDLALVLAVDVSGSVDASEYKVQRDGLALALRDPLITEALVRAEAAVMVLQWTGKSRQRVTVPWVRVTDFDQADRLADLVTEDPRVWRNFSTAIGEAMQFSATQFVDVPDCDRHVIDISGDGISNEGAEPLELQSEISARNITINALVIEGVDEDLTGYFWENVISGPGAFVETANGFEEYPSKIRKKLLREITKQVSQLK